MESKWKTSSSLFVCPLCGKQMKVSESSIICEKKHCYDISRKGYINFVQKSSAKVYNAELFEHRHFLYSSGFYDEIIETMNLLVKKHIHKHNYYTIVDAGCGEGSFLIKLCNCISGCKIGFDISKDAVLQASRSSKEILWLVADLVNIPLKADCVDVLFNIFTPANYQSFNRILREDGIMVKVIPGIEYLKELRNAVGEKIKKQNDDEEQVIDYLSQYMEIVEKKKVYYKVKVDFEQMRSWARMTPMTTNILIEEETLLPIKHITIDVIICVCRKLEVN